MFSSISRCWKPPFLKKKNKINYPQKKDKKDKNSLESNTKI